MTTNNDNIHDNIHDKITFEEKIIKFRKTFINDKIHRMLVFVFFVPIIILSFMLALVSMPISYVLYGKPTCFLDKVYYNEYNTHYWQYYPIIIGTAALFFDKEEFYQKIRENEISQL